MPTLAEKCWYLPSAIQNFKPQKIEVNSEKGRWTFASVALTTPSVLGLYFIATTFPVFPEAIFVLVTFFLIAQIKQNSCQKSPIPKVVTIPKAYSAEFTNVHCCLDSNFSTTQTLVILLAKLITWCCFILGSSTARTRWMQSVFASDLLRRCTTSKCCSKCRKVNAPTTTYATRIMTHNTFTPADLLI